MAPPAVLSLFSGIGGIDLGLKRAGFRTVCYCENDPYAVRVLQARMDGSLDEAPVWDDVRTFDGKEWRDEIDLIAGGFPCQDLSFAGKRAGINGSRSGLWAEMFRAVCEVRPRHVLVENVPGILVGGLGRVLGDLASAGYDAVWTVLSAADVGAPHLRKRVFIVAHPHEDGRDGEGLPSFPWEEGTLPTGGGEGEEGLMFPTPSATPYGSNRGGAMGRVGKERPSLETMARKGMWPTPGAGDAVKARLNPAMARRVQLRLDGVTPTSPAGANYQESLPERVALEEARFWRTPGASDGEGGVMEMRPDADGHYKLRDQVQEANREFWPTPTVTTDTGGAALCKWGGAGARAKLRKMVTPQEFNGALNPAWVEWLVGVPVGWTDLECAGPEYPEGLSFGDAWAYDPHPAVPRVAKGVPKRAQRLRCLGNIVVPQCAERIGKRIRVAYR